MSLVATMSICPCWGTKALLVLAKSMSWSVSYRNLVYIVYIRDILANLAIISLIHESIWYVGVCGNICVHYSLSVSDGEHNGVKVMSKKKVLYTGLLFYKFHNVLYNFESNSLISVFNNFSISFWKVLCQISIERSKEKKSQYVSLKISWWRY